MSLFVRTLTLLLGPPTKQQAELLDEWLADYAAELYQDVYTPEYQLDQRAALQRKRADERKAAADRARMLRKVDKFG